jgi:hypothetical protein
MSEDNGIKGIKVSAINETVSEKKTPKKLPEKFQKQMTFGYSIIRKMIEKNFISSNVSLQVILGILHVNDSLEEQMEFYEHFETNYKNDNVSMKACIKEVYEVADTVEVTVPKKRQPKPKKTEENGNNEDAVGIKKETVTRESDLVEGGVFCFMPYDSLDLKNKSRFKIETAIDIDKALANLKQYYPMGFFLTARLMNPKEKNTKRKLDNESFYDSILGEILNSIKEKGGEIKAQHVNGWIYCREETIHEEFLKASEKYGGELKQFDFVGERTKTPKFVGKMVYHT